VAHREPREAVIEAAERRQGAAVSPDGKRVYIANLEDNSVSVIDTFTNTALDTLTTGFHRPVGVAFSPDGKRVYVADSVPTGTLTVIDASNNTVIGTIPTAGAYPSQVAVSPDGHRRCGRRHRWRGR